MTKRIIVTQTTQSGQIFSSVGDHQQIVLTQQVWGSDEEHEQEWPERDEEHGEEAVETEDGESSPIFGSDETIIAPIGRGASIIINGKRVR